MSGCPSNRGVDSLQRQDGQQLHCLKSLEKLEKSIAISNESTTYIGSIYSYLDFEMKEIKGERKLNKMLIGAILGTTILWLGAAAMTPKGKSTIGKLKDFLKWWMKEMKKSVGKTAMKKGKSRAGEDDEK